ncbi:unnamed protein product [Blepharisma stoltei]|uniref:ODAD1 central coiled coil region domain-containing protein n=1 Tax=Blepharisma stoltei TaxID=1481888 RepID=A0AAU9IYY0_9CILI|nr:unnamed protein product [Blepharisma stoltei]
MNQNLIHLSRSISEVKLPLLQNEVQSLESEVEALTRKLEHERRQSTLLGKDLEEIKAMLNERISKNQYKSREKRKKQGDDKIKMLENELEREFKRLSELKSTNKKLQDKIDMLRKDKGSLLKSNQQLEIQLLSTTRLRKSASEVSVFNFNKDEINQGRIVKIQNSLSSTRNDYSQKISLLSSQLLEGKMSENRFLKGITVNFAEPTVNASELFQLSKNQAKVWKDSCIEINEKINSYMDFIKELNSGMETMTNQCKIDSFQEIVDLFVTTFDENTRLSQYMYELGEEIIIIQKEIEKYKDQISNFHKTRGFSESTKAEKIDQINKAYEETVKNIEAENDAYKKTQEIFQTLLNPISEIEKMLSGVGFTCREFQLETDLSEINIIEECISTLLAISNEKNEGNKNLIGRNQSRSPLIRPLEIDIDAMADPDETSRFFTLDEIRNKASKAFDQIIMNKAS